MAYVSVEIDVDDYLDSASDDALLREVRERNLASITSINDIKVKSLEDSLKLEVAIKWINENFRNLTLTEFENKFKVG